MKRIIIAYLGLIITCSGLVSAFSVGPIDFTWGDAQDPYYQMESQNLNTMNSYFVPSNPTPLGKDGGVDLTDYVHISQDTQDRAYVLTNTDARSNAPSVVHYMSSYNGVRLLMIVIVVIGMILRYKSDSSFSHTITLGLEGIYEFFDDILGDVPSWIKKFVLALFSVIFMSNLLGWLSDVVRFFFPWILRNITAPTAELEFTIALAIVSTVAILYTQGKAAGGPIKLLHEYIPVTGKGLMADNKFGDIIISLFIGLLDIVGIFARIISLSLRLFGNMSAGSILLNVAFLGLGAATIGLLATNIPLGIPIIVYVQGILSVLIQAFVFSLIVAIGLKMAHEG